MDPNLQAILLGLLTNGLTAFIAQFGRKDSKLILGEALVKRIKWEETAVQPILQKAANTVAEKIDWRGVPPLEIVCLFLTSPEAQSIIRQLFATQITLHNKHKDLTSIREEFLISCYLYATSYSSCAELKEDQLTEVGNILFESLLEGCELALDIAINEGNLPSHEAKSAFRHRLVVEELAAIQEKVTFLTSKQKPNVKEILAFEETYRRLVGNRHKYITPPILEEFDRYLLTSYMSPLIL